MRFLYFIISVMQFPILHSILIVAIVSMIYTALVSFHNTPNVVFIFIVSAVCIVEINFHQCTLSPFFSPSLIFI